MRVSLILALLFGLPALFIENNSVKIIIFTICGCIAVFGPIIEKQDKDLRK